ncbi:MAG: hypothetical protein AB8G86_20480 [Saprospiraceae bacterium]
MNLETTKLKIIKAIAESEREILINQILSLLPQFKQNYIQPIEDVLAIAKEPIPNYISLDTLKKEQGYSIKKMNLFYTNLDRSIWGRESFRGGVKRNWGDKRKQQLLDAITEYIIHPIKMQPIFDNYAEIDAYSQSKLVNKPLLKGVAARNMGKNDLWLAATSYAINAKLVTTDKDFDHLNHSFLEIDRMNLSPFI